jgi:hypothetical protein
METAMKHAREVLPVRLPARSVYRLEDAKGQQITVLSGVVWVTQANDPRDIILTRGRSFIIDRKGLTVAYALKDAAIAVGPAGHISAAEFDPDHLRGLAA